MGDYEDYAFVTKGNKRREIVISLFAPKRPKELVKELKLHFSVVSKVLKQLSIQGLTEPFEKEGKKYFKLTERGEHVRKILLS
jgi:predicted transcriptional regulator